MKKTKKSNWIKKIKIRPEKMLIISGLVLLIFASSLKAVNVYKKGLVEAKANQEFFFSGHAAHINIPQIKLNANIKSGGIIDNQWLISDNDVMVLPLTGKPGEGFNTILYAHNQEELFANLKNLSIDDKIFIQNQLGQTFTYNVYFKAVIDPNQVEKIYSNMPNIITLFTCDGGFDQSRLIIRAQLISSQ